MELNDKKFAVLVDADNISHRKIKDILDEIANYGTPAVCHLVFLLFLL